MNFNNNHNNQQSNRPPTDHNQPQPHTMAHNSTTTQHNTQQHKTTHNHTQQHTTTHNHNTTTTTHHHSTQHTTHNAQRTTTTPWPFWLKRKFPRAEYWQAFSGIQKGIDNLDVLRGAAKLIDTGIFGTPVPLIKDGDLVASFHPLHDCPQDVRARSRLLMSRDVLLIAAMFGKKTW